MIQGDDVKLQNTPIFLQSSPLIENKRPNSLKRAFGERQMTEKQKDKIDKRLINEKTDKQKER